MRGTGEGHRPWDLMPNSTMTNANIESEVASADGKELVLKYKDGEKKFIVPANIEVVMFAPAAVADLKPGEKIFVVARQKAARRQRAQHRASSSAGTASIRRCKPHVTADVSVRRWPLAESRWTASWHGNCSPIAVYHDGSMRLVRAARNDGDRP